MGPGTNDYPQFKEGAEAAKTRVSATDPDAYRFAPAVHNRPGAVERVERTELGAAVVFEPTARKSVLSYTHETALHLYKPAAPTVERLYLRIELWAENVFRLVFSDREKTDDPYAGLPRDMRMLIAEPEPVKFTFEDNTIRTGALTIEIGGVDGCVRAFDTDGKEVFSELRTDFKAADIYDLSLSENDKDRACFEAVSLDPDEVIYGLGERFDSVTRNGRTVDFHNKDAVGTTSRRSYVNVPFFLSTKGYGLFLNSAAKTDWQIATYDLGAAQFAVMDDRLDYFVIAGATPKEILKGYCRLTGFAPLPPLWSFGLWLSRNSYVSWEVAESVAEEARARDIPCDVIHLDTAWFREDWNCDLKFSKERFPDPEEHIKKLGERGFHVSLWQYNFIPPRDNNTHYHEALERGYLVRDRDGAPYRYPKDRQGSWTDDVIVDFSDPEARKWYAGKIRGLMETGAAAIKTDFGEGVPEDGVYRCVDGRRFHDLYSLVYNATVFGASKDDLVWARSGTAGRPSSG